MEKVKPEDVEALYAVPPDEFIEARAKLAAKLKGAGDAEAAKEASALRKPTVAAWAINRLARDRSDDVKALLQAGRRLGEEQRKTLAGGSRAGLQEATRRRRALVEKLVASAAAVLRSAGLSPARANLDKVADSLSALATDEEAADRVQRGVLEKELPAPAGFGEGDLEVMLAASIGAPKPARGKRPSPSGDKRRAADKARARAEELSAAADQAEEEATRLERQATEADHAAARARGSAATARHRAEQARRRADQALSKLP